MDLKVIQISDRVSIWEIERALQHALNWLQKRI